MNERIQQEYSYLWNGTQSGWVLLEIDQGSPSVFNEERCILLHIENSDVNRAVCEMMKRSGARTINRVPVKDVEIELVDEPPDH